MHIIYKLTSPSDKSYVGQTRQKSAQFRFSQHVQAWKRWVRDGKPRKSYQTKLYWALDVYPHDEWTVEVLETCEADVLDEREAYWISKLDTMENGYNVQSGGQGWRTGEVSAEHKKSQSEARKRYYESEDGQAWKKQLSERWKGNKVSAGREVWNKGKKAPQISESRRANPTVITDEMREASSKRSKEMWEQGVFDNRPKPTHEQIERAAASNRGRKRSEETKRLMREAWKNRKPMTEETKQLISEQRVGHKMDTKRCPHCGKIGGGSGMSRFHFDNCKEKGSP